MLLNAHDMSLSMVVFCDLPCLQRSTVMLLQATDSPALVVADMFPAQLCMLQHLARLAADGLIMPGSWT